MSVTKINSYACIQGKTSSLATAKLAIFATDILWESCSKIDIEQLLIAFSSKIWLVSPLLLKICPLQPTMPIHALTYEMHLYKKEYNYK